MCTSVPVVAAKEVVLVVAVSATVVAVMAMMAVSGLPPVAGSRCECDRRSSAFPFGVHRC